MVTPTKEHQIILLFNIIEILNKLKIYFPINILGYSQPQQNQIKTLKVHLVTNPDTLASAVLMSTKLSELSFESILNTTH